MSLCYGFPLFLFSLASVLRTGDLEVAQAPGKAARLMKRLWGRSGESVTTW